MFKLQIIPYTPSDKIKCIEAFESNVPTYFAKEEIEEFKAFLTKLENGSIQTKFFVVALNDEVIGCGGFGDKNNTSVVSLAWGLIHKNYHKQGFGEKLLRFRLERIKETVPNLPVIVDTTQFTSGFFEKFGFQTTKITNDYYADGLHRYDMILCD
jgi:ribosomal protein S18 acetylase RimI-like enzyme